MPPTLPIQQTSQKRLRGSKTVGRITLGILFIFLTGMNLGASAVIPLIGYYGRFFMAGIIVATIWNAMLLGAVAFRQAWARFILAGFLLCFVVAQAILIPDVVTKHPYFREDGLHIVLLLCASNIFAAIYLLVSKDIFWLTRPPQH